MKKIASSHKELMTTIMVVAVGLSAAVLFSGCASGSKLPADRVAQGNPINFSAIKSP